VPALINLLKLLKYAIINVELHGWINLVKLGDSGFSDDWLSYKGLLGVE
jgi:hypothetical protein